jgi:hypothetical protein
LPITALNLKDQQSFAGLQQQQVSSSFWRLGAAKLFTKNNFLSEHLEFSLTF